MSRMPNIRPAFTLIELVIVLAITAMLVAVILPATGLMRTESRLASSRDNLGQIGKAGGQYSAASDGFIAGYDWTAGNDPWNPQEFDIGGGETGEARDNLTAAHLQQAAILRKASGRYGGQFAIKFEGSRVPHRRFLLLPLIDWLGGTLPDPIAVSPLDVHLQTFQQDPLDYESLPGGDPDFGGSAGWSARQVVNRWPFASSYQTTVYAWSPSGPDESGRMSTFPSNDGTTLFLDASSLGQQTLNQVSHPSHKAFLFEEFDYSQGLGNQGLYYADPAASVNVLFFDGSARRIATEDANPGWDAENPCDMSETAELFYRSIDTRYFRDYSDPDTNPPMAGYYKWTRGGLFGIDVGAGEISTSNWCE